MHQAALLGHAARDAKMYGWDIADTPSHSWYVSSLFVPLDLAECNTCAFFSKHFSGQGKAVSPLCLYVSGQFTFEFSHFQVIYLVCWFTLTFLGQVQRLDL